MDGPDGVKKEIEGWIRYKATIREFDYNFEEMNKILKNTLAGMMLILGFAVLYVAYVDTHKLQSEREHQLSALLLAPSQEQKPLQLNLATKSEGCQAQGPLPDPACTPGAVFSNAAREIICVTGYTKTVRDVSTSVKKKVFAKYGIRYPVPFGSYEVDHLIPLELGGNNDVANLWPKSAEPFPGFYEKNITGHYLRQEVCGGRVALTVAQQHMADNWFLVYKNMDQKIIEDLKDIYRNWADRGH